MAKRYRVEIDADAEADALRIFRELKLEAPASARAFLADFRRLDSALEAFPERGSIPRELDDLGSRDFRQRALGTYRAIYRVTDGVVHILLVAHERQQLQPILQRRGLRP